MDKGSVLIWYEIVHGDIDSNWVKNVDVKPNTIQVEYVKPNTIQKNVFEYMSKKIWNR